MNYKPLWQRMFNNYCTLTIIRIFFLSLALNIFTNTSQGQNLIVNPSFEDTISIINYSGLPKLRANNWISASNGSPDFFNSQVGVPNSGFGYQFPRTGDAHMGLMVYAGFPYINRREYIEGSFIDTLIVNHEYCITFHVCSSNTFMFTADGIGAFISKDSIFDSNNDQTINIIPQVENVPGNILNDTLNWMPISGSFIAQGGEKYITIGNFKNDSSTMLDTNFGGFYDGSYYFIDDVSLVDCTVGIQEIKVPSISIVPNPATDKISISIDNITAKEFELEIINITGQIIYTIPRIPSGQPFSLDVSFLDQHIYFLKIRTKDRAFFKKFVKM